MNITLTCTGCGQKLSAPGNLAGRRMQCPKCKTPIDVPAAATELYPVVAVDVPQVVPEDRPRPAQSPPPAPAAADAAWLDLGLGEPIAPRPVVRPPQRSNGALAPIIAVVAVLLLGGAGVGAWLMLSANAGVGSDLNYLPDDPDIVISFDVNGIISSSVGQKIKAQASAMLGSLSRSLPQDSKIKPEDVGRMTIGARLPGDKGAGVVHFNRAISDQDFPAASRGEKKTVGQYQMSVNAGSAFCRIDDRTIAMGDEAALRGILERNGPPKLSDDLAAAMGEVDFSKSVAVAASMRNFAQLAGAAGASPLNMAAMPGGSNGRGLAMQADIGGDIQLKIVIVYKDGATASQMKTVLDGGVAAAKTNISQMPPVAAKILNTVGISSSGASLRATATIDSDAVAMLIDMVGKGGMIPSGPTATQSTPMRTPAPVPTPAPARAPPPLAERTPKSPPAPLSGKRTTTVSNGVANARDAAAQAEASNKLKQVALAMHAYLAAEGHFPAPAIYDAEGKPLLSWRVAILPQLGQEALYKQFHLDEAWDSPANKRLSNRMPAVYHCLRGKRPIGIGKTCILAPVGEKCAFFGQQGRKADDFSDVLPNTILVVEAGPERAVPWTKPDDLIVDESDPAAGLFGLREGGALAAFADGSVRLIPQTTTKEVMAALFTINGGETIPPDFGVK